MLRRLLSLALLGTLATISPAALAAELPEAARPVNQFGADLYHSLSAGGDNVFYSAYSIHSALSMTLAGARGQTAQQMQSVLHVQSPNAAADNFHSLAEHLNKVRDEQKFELNIANSLWGEQSIGFRDAFTGLLKDRYGSELFKVDFRNAADAARTKINAWVSDQTKKKIPDLIPAGMLTARSRLVLVNAIYFKAAWADPFEKSATRDGDFHLVGGQTATVPLMHQTLRTRYAEQEGLQILDLPYGGGATSMLILLPTAGDLSAAERILAPDELDRAVASLRPQQVDVTLPSFKLRFKTDLSRQLASLGMPLAFSDTADFSSMTDREPLQISNVVHEAFVAVDEQGTEAAAATAVMMRTTAIMMPQQTFRADHPFVFVIRDNASGAVLFAGRLMKPEK